MFEYKEVYLSSRINSVELKELGKDRWEMCGSIKDIRQQNYAVSYTSYIYYFKRPILEYDM